MSRLYFDFSHLRQVFLQAVIIICFGIGTGLMFNFPLLMQVFNQTVPVQGQPASEPALNKAPRTAHLEDVERLLTTATLVDARIPELYAEGHLPGAVSLPFAELEGRIEPFYTRVAKDEPLIIYCSGYGCPDSFDLAILLLAEGYADVRVFEGGYPQWRDAGKPVETDLP